MRCGCAAALACLSLPVSAEDLRPAPDYFIDAVASITIAERIARVCPSIGFDTNRAAETTDEILGQLSAEGFDIAHPRASMADPGPAIRGAQAAFRARHGLAQDDADVDAICTAGRAEILSESPVGAFLIELNSDGASDREP